MTHLLILFLGLTLPLFPSEKLDSCYQVSFGDPSAPIHIVEYFSFSCPQCIRLFNRDFQKINQEYIEQNKVHWTFHPLPMDLPTLQGMHCLANLQNHEKQLFFKTILSEAQGISTRLLVAMMKKAMEVFSTPLSDLSDPEYLKQTKAFQAAFDYINQERQVHEVPMIEIDGQIYSSFPDWDFIHREIELRLQPCNAEAT